MKRKVIPFKKKCTCTRQGHSSTAQTRCEAVSSVEQKVSGDNRGCLAGYLKEEAERVRTMALLMEVAETICREEKEDDK
ncbi:hypothetical protein [Anoxynatronum buryatiense]|uniref:Uncharacterized protein n=1 Tax=Anoxynatronum buryatiense TaxID=489973 RepID=A0AA46AIM3_9CLOT|nr:hypothetical protein [Anoxynatronum buryatiense]SMP51011.1 hypothetical protein SAMN06296020_10445 [Anoxynatronum buryatiense]